MNNILKYTNKQLQDILAENKFKKFNADQIFEWIYTKNELDFSKMTNLSLDLRKYLSENFNTDLLEELVCQESNDGTVKFLFKLCDNRSIETVLMPQSYGQSVCVTTQVGCNMGCTFCASGIIKKIRNLEVDEIIAQVYYVNRFLKNKYPNDTTGRNRVSHIVVMGIGEPLDNYENTLDFINILNSPKAFGIGARHITVSTCGLVPKIKAFADLQLQANLAISLHAPNDEIRNQIMPINKAFPLVKLMEAVDYYIEKTNRRITFEYILIDKVNDSVENAHQLAALIKGKNAYVNLIPYNEVHENPFRKSTNIDNFFKALKSKKINCIVRKEFGADIDAACGQLRAIREGILK
ncbi:23S rRNA (adenine(2503)-C(2))-methyltransferase RlmN [Spiroplasma endosymbiont of Panorpa germanica]|uniref:23S rRNA (adenine(2503)-C(2))-methyltransferase RlmN n=1 Tax=Spiroplasma endosymbiont of Panorpa germanica TaxID=3066314 RepID=UPI0030CEFE91